MLIDIQVKGGDNVKEIVKKLLTDKTARKTLQVSTLVVVSTMSFNPWQ